MIFIKMKGTTNYVLLQKIDFRYLLIPGYKMADLGVSASTIGLNYQPIGPTSLVEWQDG